MLEELAALLEAEKRRHVDEMIVIAFRFAGSRRARRVRH
jgi:hypothetical protein